MKKIIAILLITIMAIGAAACQKTPESPIVVGKNADNLIEQATGDDGSYCRFVSSCPHQT